MAQFEIALKKTLAWEGGYSNDKNDHETFCGINRDAWPNEQIWDVIDKHSEFKKVKNFLDLYAPEFATHNGITVREGVLIFYRLNFWQPIRGDEIESQEIANYLFDFAVNSGIGDAVKALQWGINKTVYTAVVLKVDGDFGPKTWIAFRGVDSDYLDELLAHMRTYRLHHILKNIGNGHIHPSFAKGLGERALA